MSIQDEACNRPRYSTAGAGGAGTLGAGAGGHASSCTGGQINGATAGAGGAGVAHPTTAASRQKAPAHAPIEDNRAGRNALAEDDVGWVFLEIGLALAIAVAIVWWTLPRKPKPQEDEDER